MRTTHTNVFVPWDSVVQIVNIMEHVVPTIRASMVELAWKMVQISTVCVPQEQQAKHVNRIPEMSATIILANTDVALIVLETMTASANLDSRARIVRLRIPPHWVELTVNTNKLM